MDNTGTRSAVGQLVSNYGMAGVLLLLCVYYSWATLQYQTPAGAAAGELVATRIAGMVDRGTTVVIVAGRSADDRAFAERVQAVLQAKGCARLEQVEGDPAIVLAAFQARADKAGDVAAIASAASCTGWLESMVRRFPSLANTKLVSPEPYRWPTFLQTENLLNVADQIVVIALIAVGMTMVIVTGGIDLSVGSLVALSAVVTALLIRDVGGATRAGTMNLVLCSLGGIAVSGVVGLFSGVVITWFRIPPFIATLAMMQVASGVAYILSAGQSIYEIPPSFVWLGRGTGPWSIPNAVLLMAGIYVVAHVVMSHTAFGRYVYAVGGNAEAARLSGVRVGRVLLLVYLLSGLMAGVGGVVVASQLKSGSPTYGLSYELYVIAAVVVGGTSLSGGSGKILGTLIGAFIIAVIQNGMNLTKVESYRQKVVLGLVILGAVLLDMLRKRGWNLRRQ
ncbi:MAG: ABC transporter permease [Tepidisphaeraceae bacterium]|jgi:ribose transport system permease protein